MTINSTRHEQVGAFFLTHASRVRIAVAGHARGSDDIVDDACAIAWSKLVRRSDVTLDARGLSWLTTVAIHEAWRLHRTAASEMPVGAFQGDSRLDEDEEWYEPRDWMSVGTEDRALDRIQHEADLQAFATLKLREKQALCLQALGFSYNEIGALMGSLTRL